MSTQDELLQRYDQVMANAFGTPKRVFVRGEGIHLFDADGRAYVDLLSGIAVTALGHNHHRVNRAITSQLATLGHISNLFASENQIRLAERLTSYAGGGRVFFTNSGSEANETAFKISRLTGHTRVVALEGSFHGRTMGALALTHTPKYREPFEPLPGDVEFIPHGDLDALRGAIDDRTAALVLEVIQGENGVIALPDGYLREARRITQEAGALLWIDEVQTGIGRCGEVLLHRAHGVSADLVTLAKGLGNGFPIGACLALGPAADLLQPGLHGNTFAGNPVATAAGNAVLDELESGVLEHARSVGQWLTERIEALDHPDIREVRGAGLLRGVVLKEPKAAAVVDAMLEDGWVANAPRPDVIRLAPPLITRREDLADLVATLPGWLARV